MSVESILYAWITDVVAGAAQGSHLYGADVHDSTFRAIEKPLTIQVGRCDSHLAPGPGAEEMEEFDAEPVVIILVQVADKADYTTYAPARDEAVAAAKELALALVADMTLG